MESKKKKRETFKNLKMVFANIFVEVVDTAFHLCSKGLATKALGNTPPVYILANIQRLYGKLIYQELNAVLFRLNEPMNKMKLVEIMLRGIGEV